MSERDGAEEFASDGIGSELRYGSNGEYDGDQLVVATGKGLEQALVDCATEQSQYIAGCVNTDQGVLMWEAQTPEEDPGVVYVFVDKGETGALLFYSGPPITGDPRELNMPISTEVLFAIANDPRVDVTTTAAAVEAGASLSYWESD